MPRYPAKRLCDIAINVVKFASAFGLQMYSAQQMNPGLHIVERQVQDEKFAIIFSERGRNWERRQQCAATNFPFQWTGNMIRISCDNTKRLCQSNNNQVNGGTAIPENTIYLKVFRDISQANARDIVEFLLTNVTGWKLLWIRSRDVAEHEWRVYLRRN